MLNVDDKVKIFKALSNKTRFLIVKNLLSGSYACSIDDKQPEHDIIAQATCVTSLAKEFNFKLPTISRHVKELKEANLITMTKVANKIYLEPNLSTIESIYECFGDLVKNYENSSSYTVN